MKYISAGIIETMTINGQEVNPKDFIVIQSNKMTSEAEEFISKHIEKHIKEGMPEDKAKAAAYEEARKHGYDIPEK